MPYLIDGSNLIGHIPTLELSDPDSKRRLVKQLLIFQKRKKTKIILVFDGPPNSALLSENNRSEKFLIIWPDWGETADTVIKQWTKKQTDLRHFHVVSSDREIKAFARANKAKILDCKEFHKLLKKALKDEKESKAMNKEDLTLSPLEVDHWREIFGDSDE
jgi:predicted RNA-binding protein with PIN domain